MTGHGFLSWLARTAIGAAGMFAIALLASVVIRRVASRAALLAEAGSRCRRSGAVLAVLIGVQASIPSTPVSPPARAAMAHVMLLALIGAGAWLAIDIALVIEDRWLRRYDIGASNNLLARKKRTQILVLNRVTVAVLCVITAAVMLMTFHQVRSLGTSLLASAGLVGLVAGAAARPTLGNLVAGVQIAFSEPIRLDDVVVVEGQWGRVEEITLSYVVVRLWDLRRLVLPISWFVENPFENWTRSSAQILGSAMFHLDHRAPIDEIRDEFQRILDSSPRWDGHVGVLQVTDATELTVEVRALMSAVDSSTSFDLRCEVRERLLGWLQAHHPESLPRVRTELAAPAQAG